MSDETTEGKSVPGALRMIAGWLETGTKIEYRYIDSDAWLPYHGDGMSVHLFSCVYRAKPRKPLVMSKYESYRSSTIEVIELTPAVIASGKRDGWLP